MFIRQQKVQVGNETYTYLKVVESRRENRRMTQRTLVNLGNVNRWPEGKLEQVVELLAGFLKMDMPQLADVRFTDCKQLGPYLPLSQLWDDLGLDNIIRRALADRKIGLPVADYVKVMVFNRLVAPRSKRAVWEKAARDMQIPNLAAETLNLHGYYRALEYLNAAKRPIEQALHHRVQDLFNQDLSLVFYDLTSSYFEGTACAKAKRGYSREHRPDLVQIEIGLLVDAQGIPIGHEVFDGNVAEVSTVLGVLERLKKDFGVHRCIFVGDDGMASEANLAQIEAQGYEYITSLALRNSNVSSALLRELPPLRTFQRLSDNLWFKPLQTVPSNAPELDRGQSDVCTHRIHGGAQHERCGYTVRYIGAYNPARAATNRHHRKARLKACLQQLHHLANPPKGRGRKRTPEEAERAADRFLRQKHCQELIRLQRTDDGRFCWTLERAALRQERRRDGLMILQTNARNLSDQEVAIGYRTLWRVENAFRHIKDVVQLRPIRHWSDPRVLGHVHICVMAYMLERLMDQRLERAGETLTARAALDELSAITVATLQLNDQRIRRRSEITASQQKLLAAAGVGHVPELW